MWGCHKNRRPKGALGSGGLFAILNRGGGRGVGFQRGSWSFTGRGERANVVNTFFIRVLRGCSSARSRFFYLDPFRRRRGGPEVLSGSFDPS